MLPYHAVFEEMNVWGAKKIPFVFVLDFELQNPWICTLENLEGEEVFFDLQGNYQFLPKNSETSKHNFPIFFQKYPISFERYQKAFALVRKNIFRGNSYLLNLSAPTPIKTNLSLLDIFQQSQAKYKLLFKNQFVCFSPEIFVKINQNQIRSYPMKGTMDAKIPNASELILQNEKELAEHYTIVDLIRNDLSMISSNVRVEKFRYLDTIHTLDQALLQVSSEIVGDLETNWHNKIGDIFWKMLPAGSISGAPKRKTVEIIQEAENLFELQSYPYHRGFYTGVFGVFDGVSVDSAVMIRFIENIQNTFFFKSGCGITALSDAVLEYQELIQKVYVPIIRND